MCKFFGFYGLSRQTYMKWPLLGMPTVVNLNKEDVLIRELMTSLWTNFATCGDPTPPNSGLSWTPQGYFPISNSFLY